ncbi:hypothetical protein M0R45_002498 [Rubus argutus]|uniref:Uncharacterized protein n=1 Tax=Rubus argutus TaxID=59490 RepID=A0AAW1VMU1_RUBAR
MPQQLLDLTIPSHCTTSSVPIKHQRASLSQSLTSPPQKPPSPCPSLINLSPNHSQNNHGSTISPKQNPKQPITGSRPNHTKNPNSKTNPQPFPCRTSNPSTKTCINQLTISQPSQPVASLTLCQFTNSKHPSQFNLSLNHTIPLSPCSITTHHNWSRQFTYHHHHHGFPATPQAKPNHYDAHRAAAVNPTTGRRHQRRTSRPAMDLKLKLPRASLRPPPRCYQDSAAPPECHREASIIKSWCLARALTAIHHRRREPKPRPLDSRSLPPFITVKPPIRPVLLQSASA